MRTVSRGICGLLLAWAFLALAACGGGGGSSTPTMQNASLSYPSGAMAFTIGTAITGVKPTITGTLTAFSVSPALPAGVAVDPNSGTIGGTPSAVTAAANYTINATGPNGASASATVNIAVNDVSPKASYAASTLTYTLGVPGSTFQPNTSGGGTVVSWSVNPALPTGLDFDTTNGSISGTPTVAATAAPYVITAKNSGGSANVTLTVEVDATPLMHLGHQSSVTTVRETSTNVFSEDALGTWILWNYASASIVAHGVSGCVFTSPNFTGNCSLDPAIDMAGTTAVIVTPTGFEIHSTSDGSTLGTIASSAPNWWKLAADGSYIAVGSSTGVSAWSTSGQQLFANSGDYSRAVAFAAAGQLQIANGRAGTNVIESITVPSGSSTTGAQFNGTFAAWFTNGGNFITTAGSTALVYSNAIVQQQVLSIGTNHGPIGGQGNWVWVIPANSDEVDLYPATGTPTATPYVFASTVTLEPPTAASGAVLGAVSSVFSVIDLSGATPVKTDYTTPSGAVAAYALVSTSQWVSGAANGVLEDGATATTTPRYFGVGQVTSIAGGSGHFAVGTPLGIYYFDAATLAQEGQIAFNAGQLALSTDGTTLAAVGAPAVNGITGPVNIYTLPAGGAPLNVWSDTPFDIDLSGSGTVLGQLLWVGRPTSGSYSVQANPATGGSAIFSSTFSDAAIPFTTFPPLRVSPDGTLIAYSPMGSPKGLALANVATSTNLLLNGTLVTAFNGLTVGWLDNTRLLVNNYSGTSYPYTGCTLYGPNGAPTNAPCAIPVEMLRFQPVPSQSDLIYSPQYNQVLSVSTGAVNWTSGNMAVGGGTVQATGALSGSHVIFVSGIDLLAQPY
jgi:hypothetical protein